MGSINEHGDKFKHISNLNTEQLNLSVVPLGWKQTHPRLNKIN